jgi:hypothetical protein
MPDFLEDFEVLTLSLSAALKDEVRGVQEVASGKPSKQSHLCFLLGQWSIAGAGNPGSSRQPTDTDSAPFSPSARMKTTDPHVVQNVCSSHCPDEPVRRQDLVWPF